MPTLPSLRVLVACTSALLVACSGGGGGGGGGGGTEPPPTVVLTVTTVGGATQSRTVGTASDEMSVRVSNSSGTVVANQAVTWTTSAGTLAASSTTTDATGIAKNTLTSVGTAPGTVTVTARAGTASATFAVTTSAGAAAKIVKVAELSQALAPGESDSVRVRVTDAFDNPVAGTSVAFTVAVGGGAVSEASRTTDAQGLAGVRFTTGATVGANAVAAAASGLTGSPLTFSVTTALAAQTLEKVGTDPTNASAGAEDLVKVRVLDVGGNPKPGVAVTFAVTAGGGTIAPTSVTTDAQGIAAASWKRGPAAGLNTATASVAGLTGSPVTFSVTTVVQANSVAYGPDVIVLDAGAVSTTASATVRDGTGTVMTGEAVTYTSATPAVATVDASGQVTGVARGQAVIVASVTNQSGQTLTDSLLAVVAVADAPVLLTDLASFDLGRDSVVTVAVLVDQRASTTKLGSGKLTVTWDPALLAYQSDADGAPNVGATVNAADAANGTLTMAFADGNGFAGRVEVRRITFKAASTARTGTLAVTASELHAAGSYANLLPAAVSVTMPLRTR